MEITEVRVSLREETSGVSEPPGAGQPGRGGPGEKRLKAYATVTFDQCFVVRNIKIIEGRNGLFVAMPSHKPKIVCARCSAKNDAGGRFCVHCAAPMSRLPDPVLGAAGPAVAEAQAHRDIAHPITAEFRRYLQEKVLDVYEAERSKGCRPDPGRATDERDEGAGA